VQRFTFRLENVLRIRRKLEEGVQRDFSRALGMLLRVKAELEGAVSRLRVFIRENRLSEGETFTAFEIVAIDNYIVLVEREIKRLRAAEKDREEEVARVRRILNDAKKARKVIENLKERKYERYLADLNREETIELDDVGQKIGLRRENLAMQDVPIEDM
jgi:flagellar FliJ protein